MNRTEANSENPRLIRVLIADDHKLLRQGIRKILENEPGIEVVGEASDGNEAIESCKELKPDITVLDITMPQLSGIVAIKEILKGCPDTKVLILSMHSNETYITETLRNGAGGYILKDSASEDLVAAIRSVHRGEMFLSPKVATKVVQTLVGKVGVSEKSVFEILSSREQQILQLVAEGCSSKQIAGQLFISPKTVENHKASIMRKLDMHDINSLVKFAIRNGLVEA